VDYRYCINGRFLTRQITGVDRFAREIVRELDSMLATGVACLVVPAQADVIDPLPLHHIDMVRYGNKSGHWWEQFDFAKYVHKQQALGINLCNTAPFFNPGIVTIHDMNIRANPSYYSAKFVAFYRLMFSFITKKAEHNFTILLLQTTSALFQALGSTSSALSQTSVFWKEAL
jgi:hypothetical protein